MRLLWAVADFLPADLRKLNHGRGALRSLPYDLTRNVTPALDLKGIDMNSTNEANYVVCWIFPQL